MATVPGWRHQAQGLAVSLTVVSIQVESAVSTAYDALTQAACEGRRWTTPESVWHEWTSQVRACGWWIDVGRATRRRIRLTWQDRRYCNLHVSYKERRQEETDPISSACRNSSTHAPSAIKSRRRLDVEAVVREHLLASRFLCSRLGLCIASSMSCAKSSGRFRAASSTIGASEVSVVASVSVGCGSVMSSCRWCSSALNCTLPWLCSKM